MTVKTGKVAAVILAAGKGTRMKSGLPKVMHPVGGLPLLGHVMASAGALKREISLAVVLSPSMEEVASWCIKQNPSIKIACQDQQRGTADAVLSAFQILEGFMGNILIMLGDVPFVRPETLEEMLGYLDRHPDVAGVNLAMEGDPSDSYGRLVTDQNHMLMRIVEYRDATPEERQIRLCNSGFFAVRGALLKNFLREVQPSPETGELYLTDIVEIARRNGQQFGVITCDDPIEVQGINSPRDLAHAEICYQDMLREKALDAGVRLVDPSSVYFCHDTFVSPGIVIHPQVVFGPGVHIESNVEILSFCHIEGARIQSGARIGPFARIRAETHIMQDARIGNFVEIKNSTVGISSKVNHLAYVGDTDMGTKCNIGAGTITANYDGFNKWRTTIGDEVMAGSNSSLVAPVTIGTGAIIGAGSIITHDVSGDALVLGRADQKELAGGAVRLREKLQKKKQERQG